MTEVESAQPITDEMAARFAGKWVIIRGREVVRSADSYGQLMAGQQLADGDVLWCVPPTTNAFY